MAGAGLDRLPDADPDRHPGLGPLHRHDLPRRSVVRAGRPVRGCGGRGREAAGSASATSLCRCSSPSSTSPSCSTRSTSSTPSRSSGRRRRAAPPIPPTSWSPISTRLGFRLGKLGEAAAVSLIMFALLLVFTLIYVRLADARGEGAHEQAAALHPLLAPALRRSSPGRCFPSP